MTHRDRVVKLARTFRAVCAHPIEFARFSLSFGDSSLNRYVDRKYGLGHGLPTLDLLDLFPDFTERVSPYAFLEGGSTAIDLALLKALAARYDHCRYFEIGSWRGESVANVASVARECISLSLSEPEMRQAGWNERYVATARFFSHGLKNVRHIGHDSRSFDYGPYLGTCDLVFIDGDHSYDGVRSDTAHAFRLLRDDRSVIVWHDYMRTPEIGILWGVFAGLLDGAPPGASRHIYHVSNTLCAVYIQGEFPIAPLVAPATPNKEFEVRITAKKY
jgi:predicted O-methyltransferase YrrM